MTLALVEVVESIKNVAKIKKIEGDLYILYVARSEKSAILIFIGR